jgi:hypothetical protein
MSTQENLNKEKQSNNGWQNIGICKKFARKHIPAKLRTVWLELVEDSFGYCEKKTKQMTQTQMAREYGYTEKTLREQIKKLEELGLVKIIHSRHNPKGGGSEAYAYAPDFPKGYGELKWKDDSEQDTNSSLKDTRKKDKEQQDNNYF